MMKKLIILFSVLSMYCQISGFAQDDSILLTIGNNKITKGEFERIYKKNNAVASANNKSVEDYLDLFINYKLKVIEAERLGYDTTKSFIHELDGYYDQLAKPYLEDTAVTNELLKEAYERSKYEVNASHILIKMDRYPTPADTLAAYNKIMKIRQRIISGEPFEEVARATSDDPSAKMNGGNLGWFTVFHMVYPFETAAYTTPVGDVSMPVRSRYGYHIVKVNGKRPALHDIKIAHIMVLFESGNENRIKQAKNKIDKYYQMLRDGSDFSQIAMKYSEDRRSAPKGGDLGWYKPENLPPSIMNAAYSLKNFYDYSTPVLSEYGWHIIELLGKRPIGSFDQMKPELINKLSRDSRSNIADKDALKRIEKENDFVEFSQNLNEFINSTDTSLFSTDWDYASNGNMQKPLFKLNGKNYLLKDFAGYLKKQAKPTNDMPVRVFIENSYNKYVYTTVLNFEKKQLAVKYPEFRELMKEYHDGILLFNITNDSIWNKAGEDSIGLERYYQTHKNDYMWGERLDAYIYNVHDSTLLNDARKLAKKQIKKGLSNKSYLKELCPGDSIPCVEIINVKVQKDNNEYNWVKKVTWSKGSISDNFRNKDGIYFVAIKDVIPPEPKAFNDIKGIVISDYQKYLEDEWIKRLRSEYKITVNKEVLKTIN